MPYWALVPATVKVRGDFLSFDVDGFDGPFPYVVCLHLLHCGSIPVYLVLCLLCMYCNAILCVIPLDCSSVLAQSFLQQSVGFSDVCTVAFSTRYTWYTTPFFFHTGCSSFVRTRASLRDPLDLKVVLIPSGLHTL